MKIYEGRTAFIVDVHPLWLDALARLLDEVGVSVVARSTRWSDVADIVAEHEPDLVLIGLESGLLDAGLLAAIRGVKSSSSRVHVLVFAPNADDRAIEASFAVGVSAYCIKSATAEDLIVAIRQAFSPSIFLAAPPSKQLELAWTPDAADEGADLTNRELQILRLVAEGHSNSELARLLWVTEQTIKFHLANIYRKLGVANRTEASRWAQVHGLLPGGPVETAA